MAKNKVKAVESVNGDFEYKMSKEMADMYLKSRKGEDKNKHPQEYLRYIVDTQFGIKGVCSRVIVQ